MGTSEFTAGGNPAMDYHPIQGGVEILLVVSCYGNWDKFRPDGPLGSYADLPTYYLDVCPKRATAFCYLITRFLHVYFVPF